MSSRSLGTLTLDLIARVGGFEAGMDKAARTARTRSRQIETSVSGATKALGGLAAAATAAFGAMEISRRLNAVDSIGKAAEVASLTTDAVQELRNAFTSLADLTDGQVDASLRRFNRRLGLAREAAGPAKKAFDDLFGGVSQFGSTEEALDAVIERLAGIEDQSVRAAQASAFFGDDAGPLLAAALGKGSVAVTKLRRDAHDLGLVIDESLIEKAGDATTELDNLSKVVDAQLNAALVEHADTITTVTQALITAVGWAAKYTDQIGKGLGIVAGQALHGPNTALGRVNAEIEAVEASIADLEAKLARSNFAEVLADAGDQFGEGVVRGTTSQMQSALADLQAQLDAALQTREAIKAAMRGQGGAVGSGADVPVGAPVVVTPPVDPAVLDQYDKLVASLRQQRDLHGEASLAAKIGYEIANGELSKLEPKQQERLIAIAEEIDALDRLAERELELGEFRAGLAQAALARESPVDQLEREHAEQIEQLRSFHEDKLLTLEEMDALEVELWRNKQQRLTEIQKDEQQKRDQLQQAAITGTMAFMQQSLAMTTDMLQTAGKEGSSAYKLLFTMQKAAAIPSMVLATHKAYTDALASGLPYPANTIAAGSVLAMGSASIGIAAGQAIAGIAHGGLDYVPSESTYLLDKGERVVSPQQNVDLTRAVERINSGQGGGGGVEVHLHEDASRAGQVQQQRMGERDIISVFVANIRNRGEAAQVLEGSYQNMVRRGR